MSTRADGSGEPVLSRLERVPNAIREGAIYALAIGIARMTGVLLLPLLTRRLSDPELGVFGLLTSGLLVLQYAAGLGLDSGATRWFYEAESRGLEGGELHEDRRRTLSTWVWTTLSVGMLLSVAGFVLAGPIARLAFSGSASEIRATRATALAIPALAMINVLQHWYRMVRRPIPALVVAVVAAGSTLALTIALVAIGDGGVASVFVAQAIVGVAVTAAGLVQMWPVIAPTEVDRARLQAMLRYSLPLLPSVASPLLLGLLTRVLIRAFSDVDEVGEFQVVSMLATVVILFTTAFQQAWEPYALSMVDRERAKPIYRAAFVGYAAAAGLFGALLAALFPVVLPILGEGFDDLALATVVFSASLLLSGILPVVNTGPSIAGTGRPALEAMVGGTIANVAFCAVLVPPLGQIGACWAALATAALLVGVGLVRSERVWRIDFPIRTGSGVVATAVVACAALLVLRSSDDVPVVAQVIGFALVLGASGAWTLWVITRTARALRDRTA